MFIGVAGLIGAGKSTLTESLAEHLGHSPVYEPVKDNPYLEDFYEDIPRWTFPMQMHLLSRRFRQHQEVIWGLRRQGGVIQDRTIYEDTLFARMHYDDGMMDQRDYDTYISLFQDMQNFLKYPDVIVYLRVPPEIAATRIKSRGRSMEREIPIDYLKGLEDKYEQFAEEMKRYTVVVPIDWSDYKPTSEVADLIREAANTDEGFIKSLRRI